MVSNSASRGINICQTRSQDCNIYATWSKVTYTFSPINRRSVQTSLRRLFNFVICILHTVTFNMWVSFFSDLFVSCKWCKEALFLLTKMKNTIQGVGGICTIEKKQLSTITKDDRLCAHCKLKRKTVNRCKRKYCRMFTNKNAKQRAKGWGLKITKWQRKREIGKICWTLQIDKKQIS